MVRETIVKPLYPSVHGRTKMEIGAELVCFFVTFYKSALCVRLVGDAR